MSALRKVLVVDDDAVVGKSFNRVLSQKKGYVVTTVENADEALKQMREQSFDVVFTDIKMPGMDGVELAERVKASQPWTPVVIITGFGTSENEARAKAAGVTDFVRKPLSPEMIEESAVHALLEPAPAVLAKVQPSPIQEVQVEPLQAHSNLKNIALFLAAPFIGLVYALMLPLVGLAMLVWVGAKALLQNKKAMRALKNITLFAAAPFIGLAYAVLLPLVGMGMLVWVGAKALTAPAKAA